MAPQAPPPGSMNTWEAQAISQPFHEQTALGHDSSAPSAAAPRSQDPLIFPGLYCPSGFDMMSILMEVRNRPHPVIDLGPVDCSVALILCDLQLPDTPIVYASDAFCEMTGYSRDEVLGRNCRFLQTPGGSAPTSQPTVDKKAVQRMSQAIRTNQEIQLQLYNYRKNGQRFINLLSIVPIQLGSSRHPYAVGFQSDV